MDEKFLVSTFNSVYNLVTDLSSYLKKKFNKNNSKELQIMKNYGKRNLSCIFIALKYKITREVCRYSILDSFVWH